MPAAPLTYQTRSIPGGRAGTAATLRAMADLSRQGSAHPSVIEVAHRVVRHVPERDDVATMDAMLQEVRRRMRYTRDPLGVELVKAPWVVLDRTNLSGDPEPMDCDDASTLLSSMLGAVGIPTRFKVVRADRTRPDEFSHVYLAARTTQGQWVPLDPIKRNWPVGREVPAEALAGPSGYLDVGGLGFLACDKRANCRECPPMDESESMYPVNRLARNGSVNGVGGTADDLLQQAKDVLDEYVKKKYGVDLKGRPVPKTPQVTAPTRPPVTQEFRWQDWLVPFSPAGPNYKAIAVWGVAGLLAWRYFRGKKSRGGRRRRSR